MTAANAWLLLKKRMRQDGMVAKLNTMRAAITTKFSPTMPANATIGEIRDLLASIFEGGDPTREEWSIILMLNALDSTDLDWLRKNLITRFTNKTSKPTEKEVVEAINLTGYDRHQVERANAFKTQKEPGAKSKTKCLNCGNTRHSFNGCWAKGGGSAGKAPDWWKEMQKSKDRKPKKKSGEKANAAKDSNSDDSHVEKVGAAITQEDFSE
jgi:hypothetical protein